MGKKKAFIDKKKAVTYSLVYRDPSEEVDGEEDGGRRVLAPTGGQRGAQQLSDDYYDNYHDDGSLYESEYSLAVSRAAAAHHDESYTLAEERRRELMALGFPDDGYDYLKHMRDLGRGKPAPAAAGRGGVAPIPEDQELDGFDDGFDEGAGEGEGDEDEDDFTIYDREETAAAGRAAAKLDPETLAAAEAAAAAEASAAAAAAGPSTSPAGPGPSSTRAAAARAASVAAGGRGVRSTAGRSVAGIAKAGARSVASTARTDGSGLGPSVYVPAARLVPPKPDIKVVDARRLVVRPKGHDEAAAAAALADVSALARPTELHGRRGKLYQDLAELEDSIAAIENGNDPNRAEVVEGDEWADWLDEFVAGGGDEEGGAAAGGAGGSGAGAAGGADDEDDDEEEGGGASEEPEEDDDDADEWRSRHRRRSQQAAQQQQQQQQQEGGQLPDVRGGSAAADGDDEDEDKTGEGPGAGPGPRTAAGGVGAPSVASSFWRPERRDRKQGLEALDAQFERLAVEYDDDEIGNLEDERYGDADEHDEHNDDEEEADEDGSEGGRPRAGGAAGGGRGPKTQMAAGNCELADFADVLDEFLEEHRAGQELEAEGLRPLQGSDDVTAVASRPDPEALAVTKARLKKQLEAEAAAAAAAAGDAEGAGAAAEPKRTIYLQEAERWDCESILSLTSNLENHPGKIIEPQRRTGGRGGGLIKLSAKTGMPVLPGGASDPSGRRSAAAAIPEGDEEKEEEEDEEAASGGSDDGTEAGSRLDPALLERRKGETAEERKARKAAVKEARKAQRTAKKEMKNLFRQQASKAQKQAAGKSQAAGSTYVIP